MIESYRQTITTQPAVAIALGLLALFTFAVFTDVLVDLAFLLALSTGLGLLALHSIDLRVDGLGVEIRVGNGWRRVVVALEDIEGWQIDEAPIWGLGTRDAESTRRIGLGGREALRLHTRGGDVLVGLRDASEAAAAIDTWRRHAATLDTEDDPS